jgi:hypothetical protein
MTSANRPTLEILRGLAFPVLVARVLTNGRCMAITNLFDGASKTAARPKASPACPGIANASSARWGIRDALRA